MIIYLHVVHDALGNFRITYFGGAFFSWFEKNKLVGHYVVTILLWTI